MDEPRAARWFYLLEAAGPMEMAMAVLNLFLIKEKAPACIRDELLENLGGGARERLQHSKWGNVPPSLTVQHLPPCRRAGTLAVPLPHQSSPSSGRLSLLLPASSPLGRLLGDLSHGG